MHMHTLQLYVNVDDKELETFTVPHYYREFKPGAQSPTPKCVEFKRRYASNSGTLKMSLQWDYWIHVKNKDLNVGLNLFPGAKIAQITFKTPVFTFNEEV